MISVLFHPLCSTKPSKILRTSGFSSRVQPAGEMREGGSGKLRPTDQARVGRAVVSARALWAWRGHLPTVPRDNPGWSLPCQGLQTGGALQSLQAQGACECHLGRGRPHDGGPGVVPLSEGSKGNGAHLPPGPGGQRIALLVGGGEAPRHTSSLCPVFLSLGGRAS